MENAEWKALLRARNDKSIIIYEHNFHDLFAEK